MAGRIWDEYITEQDRKVYGTGAFGGTVGIGEKAAVIVVDVLNKSIGDEPLPILEAIERYGKSCTGEYGWAAVLKIRELLEFARNQDILVVYTIPAGLDGKPQGDKPRFNEKMPNWRTYAGNRVGFTFADEITPVEGDLIVEKPTASGFYNTNLENLLRERGIDTVLVTGATTSGCVRATVVDAFARGFKINLVEDATFDRAQASHAINLFDMQSKYADVVPLEEVKKRLEAREAVAAR